MAARISNLVVRILPAYTGRGPTRAWTSIDHELVTVLLRDQLTRAERRLIDAGRGELVIEMRHAIQRTLRDELTEGIEELTGRKVRPRERKQPRSRVAIESFLLAPAAEGGRGGTRLQGARSGTGGTPQP